LRHSNSLAILPTILRFSGSPIPDSPIPILDGSSGVEGFWRRVQVPRFIPLAVRQRQLAPFDVESLKPLDRSDIATVRVREPECPSGGANGGASEIKPQTDALFRRTDCNFYLVLLADDVFMAY